MKFQEQRNSDMQDLATRLQGQRTAMLTLRDPGGLLAARPLTPLEMDAQGALWFMVSRASMAAHFVAGDQAANLAFTDESKSLYVSIAGTARLVDDMSRKVALWTTLARPWFSGAEDPDLVLLCVQPRHAEIWDGPDSAVMRALAMATSVAAGRPIGLGEHAAVNLDRTLPLQRSDAHPDQPASPRPAT